ncbi:MAG: hypothetical protein QOG43_2457 [Actinomycetota bacterium]|nr:hypothetical protein [Actinomycetota bacterium]
MLVVVAILTAAGPAAGAGSAGRPDDPRRGVVNEGLQPAPAGGACAGLLQLSVDGQPVCTHGPDPAPDGVDVRQRRPPERALAASEGPSPFACFGNGTDGFRVQVIYARAADVPDRFPLYGPSFEAWTARVEQIFRASAAETGGVRHVRFLTDAACDLVIDRVVLTPTGDDTFNNTVRDLWAQGYNRTDRRYLVYVDANVYCGLGSLLGDDKPATAGNINNGGVAGTFARVDNGCWGMPDSTEAHEVMHTLGGVQPSAPHATPGFHCIDESDRMCGDDGTGIPLRYLCPFGHENSFDCNHDDYYSTNPAPGSYLATHWNVADSVFLGTVDGAATPALTWGFDGYGQLGDGTAATRVVPDHLSLTGVDAVAAGGFHSLAVVGGRVWTWGLGHVGQLGRPWPADASSPGVVAGLTGVVAVSAGVFHSVALKSDGTVWAWGWNAYGQLGDGTTTDRWQPVQVAGLTGVTAISAGATHNLALTGDGSVWSWGFNGLGQLGRTGSPLVATRVAGAGTGVTAIAAGAYHSLAIGPGNAVGAWGWNAWGQLGDGTTIDRPAPVAAVGLAGVAITSVAAGVGHSLALGADGQVRSWGLGNTGQLGRVPTTSSPATVPALVPNLAGITSIAAGGYHSLAVGAGGVVSTWGWNNLGQLGVGTLTDHASPVVVPGLTGARTVTAGIAHDLVTAPRG